jgi:hypothetical protein
MIFIVHRKHKKGDWEIFHVFVTEFYMTELVIDIYSIIQHFNVLDIGKFPLHLYDCIVAYRTTLKGLTS